MAEGVERVMSLKMNWVLLGALILKEVQEELSVPGRKQQMIKLLLLPRELV